MGFYCVQNHLIYTYCGIRFAILGLFFLCIFLKHIYFQKSTHISQNIPESQNAFHNIYRVTDSGFNKTPLF